ncbi:MAG TPA: hypothetical protein VGD55_11035 [Acidothermaceae bacterium]
MPTCSDADPLPHLPNRVLVAGASGAGKTTLARRIPKALGIAHVEIDALFHGPGWVTRPSFREDVDQFTEQPQWVTEWQYDEVRALLVARADTLVWLDLPRRTVMARVTSRTIGRRLRREQLWNGNTEPHLVTVFTDRDHIIRWAWRTYRRTEYLVAQASIQNPSLTVVRLRTQHEVDSWIAGPLANVAKS